MKKIYIKDFLDFNYRPFIFNAGVITRDCLEEYLTRDDINHLSRLNEVYLSKDNRFFRIINCDLDNLNGMEVLELINDEDYSVITLLSDRYGLYYEVVE